jgi:Flp pilus assembly protein TadG
MRLAPAVRRGTTIVEMSVVAPVALLLLIGLIVGGLGTFRAQQVSMLAKQAARWASLHGTDYANQTGTASATAEDVYNQAIKPNVIGLDLSKLSYSVVWSTDNSMSHSATINGKSVEVSNTVTVTVNYSWLPEAFLGGITLTSSSTSVMSF